MSDVPSGDLAYRRRRWIMAVVAAVAVYVIFTATTVFSSPMDRVDLFFYHLNLVPKKSDLYYPVSYYVFIGQGVPASTIAALYAIRRSRQTQAWRPWVMFVLALFLLNASVGAVKHLVGRLGPQETSTVHTVWAGGTIYPSGHAANVVVMYGLIAMLVPVAHRKAATIIASVLSVTIGLGTVALNTHWISDVFAGWAAGALVLLVLSPLTPPVDRVVTRVADRLRPPLVHWWSSTPFRPLGTPRPAVRAQRTVTADEVVADAAILGGTASAPPASDGQRPAAELPPTELSPTEDARPAASHAARGHGETGEASTPRRRVDGRSRSIRRPITDFSAAGTFGQRSQRGARRHETLTHGS